MRLLVGTILICSATVLAAPGDAPPPAPVGPSGDARPVDPYANPSTPPPPQTNTPAPSQPPTPSTNAPASPESPAPSQQPSPAAPAPSQQPSPAAPAPSQQQPAPQAPQPNTTPVDAKPQPPASEQKPLPPIDKPGPAPVDQPAPSGDKPAQSKPSNEPVTSLSPGDTAPTNTAPTDTTMKPAPMPGEPSPSATPAPRAAIVDVANAPASCREAGNRVSSRDHNTALSSKVSFALCTASSAISALSLVDAEASVNDVDNATANAFALLDEVAASGDARWQIVSLHAQGDLLGQMTRRMIDTVPPAGAGATQSAVALHDTRVQLLQSRLQPWIDRAQQAFSQVDQLARANPQLASNQMVGNAVADSRHKLTSLRRR